MGGNSSRSSDSSEEHRHTSHPGQRPKIRINTSDILNGISNKCQEWLDIINNIKQGELPDEDVQNYILQELMDTKFEIDVLVEDLKQAFVPDTRRTYGRSIDGHPPQNRKKRGKNKTSKLEAEIAQLQDRLQNAEHVKNVYYKYNRDLTNALVKEMEISGKAESERQEVLLRLSEVTGDKLRTDNPNVADLSDPNRPTKLGEMISELYDNEWTDAFEELQRNGRSERASIGTLLETFKDTYDFCHYERNKILGASDCNTKILQTTLLSKNNMIKLKRSTSADCVSTNAPQECKMPTDGCPRQTNLFLFYEWRDKYDENGTEYGPKTNVRHCGKYNGIIEDFDKRLQQLKTDSNQKSQALLKEFGEDLEPLIEQAYMDSRWTEGCIKSLHPYIRKCIYTSWMMCIQMPPMTFADLAKCGAPFRGSMYKQYTVKGPVVDYIVWPAILLHENGPVISKGVAQGKEESDVISS